MRQKLLQFTPAAMMVLIMACDPARMPRWLQPADKPSATAPASSPSNSSSFSNNPPSEISQSRLGDRNPQLHSLADFDRTTTAAFILDPPVPAHPPVVDRAVGRNGSAALRVTLPPNTVLRADPAAGWTTDWSEYSLFAAAVFSRADGVVISLEIRSGPESERVYRSAPVSLRVGWNAIRLDLDDPGPLLDRSHVTRLLFRNVGSTTAEITIDDLLLINNRENVFGSPDADEGSLFVQRAGTRLIVGAAARFELVFEAGRIVKCFDLSTDPYRLSSVCLNGPLGPVPIALHPALIDFGGEVPLDLDAPPGLSNASAMRRTQHIVEAGPLRVVVDGIWTRAASTSTQPAPDESLRWRYSIDRYGRIYVSMQTSTGGADRPPPQAVMLDAGDGGSWKLDVHSPADGTGRFARAAGHTGNNSTPRLLWIIPDFEGRVLLKSLRSPGSSLRAAVFACDTHATGSATLRSLLLLWPRAWSNLSGPEPLWADSVDPAWLGDSRQSFDVDHGTYLIRLRAGSSRFVIGHDGVQRFHPLVLIDGAEGRSIAASCNGALLSEMQKTADGRVLVELPVVHQRMELEVFIK